MSETEMEAALPQKSAKLRSGGVSMKRIFLEFLTIGTTSFGGVVPYLRGSLVSKQRWLSDKEFVEMLSISQSLPGLNATNMAILVGQKLNGALGAIVAVLGMCLPGSLLMFVVGIFYRIHGDHAWVTGALKGVAAASIGLILSTVVQLSKRSLEDRLDYVFIILTVVAVNRLHQSVLTTLVVIGLTAILWHRPRDELKEEAAR
jgi:chromate transporter